MLLYIKQLQRSFVKTSCAKAFQTFSLSLSLVVKFITVSQYLKSQFLFACYSRMESWKMLIEYKYIY